MGYALSPAQIWPIEPVLDDVRCMETSNPTGINGIILNRGTHPVNMGERGDYGAGNAT
ncbi:MAG: hypothetical protein J4F46_08070 [Dehalococcoidia bacterium]|nr:hypothetical protein [Dehalococcoidia bacterium]